MLTSQHFDWKLWINPGNNSPQSHYSSLQEAWRWPYITTVRGKQALITATQARSPEATARIWCCMRFPTICCTLTALTYTGSCVLIILFIFLFLEEGGKLPCKPSPLSWHLAFVKAILDWASNNDSCRYACSFVSLDTLANSLQAKAWI